MFKFIRRVVKFFKARHIDSVEELKQDTRKVGVVCLGSGLLAVILKFNFLGFIPVLVGLIFIYFGLTSPDNEEGE